MKIVKFLIPLTLAICGSTASLAETNVISPALSVTTAGSWSGDPQRPLFPVLVPEHTPWNSGSFWWVGQETFATWTVTLAKSYTLDRFIVQADDNDSYDLEYWNGSSWKLAWHVPPVYSWGLVTRDSGTLPTAINASALRISAVSGDALYGFSNLQAFAVPGPIAGAGIPMVLGLLGFGAWRRKKAAAA